MTCTNVLRRGGGWRHFYDRYKLRGVSNIISLEELMEAIRRRYMEGKAHKDEKHSGLKGPRYRIKIERPAHLVIVIVEKTQDCLLPITVWFEGLR